MWQFANIILFIIHGPDFIILICCDEMLHVGVMHNSLPKFTKSACLFEKISGKIWYSISSGNHMAIWLYVYQVVDKYINEIINKWGY